MSFFQSYSFHRACSDILRLWENYLVPACISGSICFFCYLVYAILCRKKKWPAFVSFLLGMYSCYVYAATFFTREIGSNNIVNLVLFSTIDNRHAWFAYENMFMLLPLGILLPVIWHRARKWHVGFLFGFLIALIIETAQYLTHTGRFELDDILFNGLGEAAGWMLYQFTAYFVRQHPQRKHNSDFAKK